MSGPIPTNLKTSGDDCLLIEWSDGQTRSYLFKELRDKCPCATCREKRNQPAETAGMLPILAPGEDQPTRVLEMKPVGSYAYTIRFNDGHDTGIFSFELLRELGEAV